MLDTEASNQADFAKRFGKILAVIVLYKMKAEDSPAYTALMAMRSQSKLASRPIQCVICDNTPYPQSRPAAFDGIYLQDLENAGLAKRYNFALRTAMTHGFDWLLLLDQDSTPTPEYFDELLRLSTDLAREEDVIAIAPKLVQRGAVLSPHLPLRLNLRKPKQIGLDAYGKASMRIQVFNSGALLRVSALEQIDGFPEHFWLDYLDHATFHQLQSQDGRVFIMRSALEHDLSTNLAERTRSLSISAREKSILQASRDYYARYAGLSERLRFYSYIFRVLAGALKHSEFKRFYELFVTFYRH